MQMPIRPVMTNAPVSHRTRRDMGGAAVAARVHRRGERQGPLERVLEDRDEEPAGPPDAGRRAAAERLRRRTRRALSASWGEIVTATTRAVPIS